MDIPSDADTIKWSKTLVASELGRSVGPEREVGIITIVVRVVYVSGESHLTGEAFRTLRPTIALVLKCVTQEIIILVVKALGLEGVRKMLVILQRPVQSCINLMPAGKQTGIRQSQPAFPRSHLPGCIRVTSLAEMIFRPFKLSSFKIRVFGRKKFIGP